MCGHVDGSGSRPSSSEREELEWSCRLGLIYHDGEGLLFVPANTESFHIIIIII